MTWSSLQTEIWVHSLLLEVRETWRSSVCSHPDTPDPMIRVFPVMAQAFNLVNVSVGSQSALGSGGMDDKQLHDWLPDRKDSWAWKMMKVLLWWQGKKCAARLKTKFICFLPMYLLFSDLLLVSLLCFSTVFVILIGSWSHTPNDMDHWGHGRWQGSPGIRWGLSGKMACCPHLPGSAVSALEDQFWVCGVESAHSCVPWAVP